MLLTATRIILPLTNVPDGAFRECSALRHATFANAVTIGHRAFEWCMALTHATFDNVQTIGEEAFRGCPFQPEVNRCS